MTMFRSGWAFAAVAIVVWGVTFASTRALLADFSSLEILVLRFSLAWAALLWLSVCPRRGRHTVSPCESTWFVVEYCTWHH